ncbi:hypothetical protein CASFOL_002547 [Castilleja foliolosa]|uniref:CCHC-type domain-containing protein n=1 Tax=Castilleja foliolosa TaxID=1961234 RepID=A0ABD3EEW4_9LAMI
MKCPYTHMAKTHPTILLFLRRAFLSGNLLSLSSMDNIKDLTITNPSNDEEDAINSLHPNPILNTKEENTIIAKIISSKPCNMNAFKTAMIKAWKPDRKTTKNLLHDNTMAFVFEEEEDMEKVLNNSWTFRDHQLVLTRWLPEQSLTEVNLDKATFWIHTIGVPVSYTNLRTAQIIGDEVGRFIKSDLSSVAQKWKRSIRIQVEIDILKPLKNFLVFSCPSRPRLMIEIRYERLVGFCYSCGLLGHKLANCHNYAGDKRDIEEEGCYGPWLKMENSHIRNPKFNGELCNKSPYEQEAGAKTTYNWPIPTARQPQRPPIFNRNINTQGIGATQMNVDTPSDLSNPTIPVKVDAPPGFPALREHMAFGTEPLQKPAVTETSMVTPTFDKMEISQKISLTMTDERLANAIIPDGLNSIGPGNVLDKPYAPSGPNLSQDDSPNQNTMDRHVTLKRKASTDELCLVNDIPNINPNPVNPQISQAKKLKLEENSPQKSPTYLNPNSYPLNPTLETSVANVPTKTPRVDLYSISRNTLGTPFLNKKSNQSGKDNNGDNFSTKLAGPEGTRHQ